MSKKRTVAVVISALLALPAGGLQLAYLIIGRQRGWCYLVDGLFYLVNAVILLAAGSAAFFLFSRRKAIRMGVLVSCSLLLLADGACFLTAPQASTTLSFSPRSEHQLVLKTEDSSGQTTLYRPLYLLFARPDETLPYSVSLPVKTQWLAEDACAVTYPSPEDGQIHQYLATYGTRNNGISYYYVGVAIEGEWAAQESDCLLSCDNTGGITLQNGAERMHYPPEECVQFGTIGLVLCRNGLPEWTIVLDENCFIDDSFIEEGGSLTLCRVSLADTAPVTLLRTSSPRSSFL